MAGVRSDRSARHALKSSGRASEGPVRIVGTRLKKCVDLAGGEAHRAFKK